MIDAQTITRIKAYAAIYSVDTTQLDELLLFRIARAANADEWNVVDDLIKKVANQIKKEKRTCG
jgi:hypothetical protein